MENNTPTMRNLRLVGEKRSVLSACTTEDDTIVDLCHNTDDGLAILMVSGAILVNDSLICSLRDLSESSSDWMSLQQLGDNSLVALSRNGAIVSIVNGVPELVGEFEYGILAAAWSPDLESLVLVTQTENDDDSDQRNTVILTMNAQWDVLAEVTIESIDTAEPVSVCWAASLSSKRIAVNSVDASDTIRRLRVYESETLHCMAMGRTEDGSGKLAPNLQSTNVCWANAGCSNLIAAIQKKGRQTTQVAFFEPNGLRHRECVLREEPDVTVKQLAWNGRCDILSVVVGKDSSSTNKVQLWHRSNYHWYLKYELCYDHPVVVQWFKEESPYCLFVYNQTRYIQYSFQWDASTLNDTVVIAVDGTSLNLTDYQICFMPPPMYANTITLDVPICQVTFCKEPNVAVFGFALLSDGRLAVVKRDQQTILAIVDKLISDRFESTCFRNIVVYSIGENSARLLAIASCWESSHSDHLLDLDIAWSRDGMGTMSLDMAIPLEGHCLCMLPWADSEDGVLLQLDDGTLFEFDGSTVLPSSAEPLLEPCPWMAAIKDPSPYTISSSEHPRKRLVVGMSARNRLYCHDILIANAITSFTLSLNNEFLAFVTSGSRCVLRFLSLYDLCNFDPLIGSDLNALLEGYEPRNVERGSRLVAILSKTPTVVLQMPRGNVEIIYPRALVLRHVMMGIKRFEYKETFELMRRQKIDLNLLVDMDPFHFLEDRGLMDFVDQILPIDYLNLFISGLQNWNSSEQRYTVPPWIGRNILVDDNRQFDFTTKVTTVCRRFREVLLQVEKHGRTISGREIVEGHFLLPILSTYAKEEPPKLDAALELIKSIALKTAVRSSKKPPLFSDAAQSAIHYLAFLADYELLFHTALESYDFEMARAVARNSQMDPKVYIPLLKRFKELPEYFSRFEVDMKLKRYDHALRNLSQSERSGENVPEAEDATDEKPRLRNTFDSCMQLIEEHNLHRLGLELYNEPMQKNRIMLSLGDYLLKQNETKSALCVYMAASPMDIERCVNAAKMAHDWSTLFQLVGSERHQSMTVDVVANLESIAEFSDRKRELFAEASRVLLDYGHDVDGGVNYLIRAEKWFEAMRVARLHSKNMLCRKVVDSAVSFAHESMENFSERLSTWETTRKRYLEVLPIRKEAIRSGEMQLGEEMELDDNGSQFSAASNTSNLSRSSTGSTSSVGSLSSVISVKSTSTFNLTGREHENRHGNKFNSKKVKKKRKHKGRNKTTPGSEKELQELVETLRATCIDPEYCSRIADTIVFLIQYQQINVARALHESYCTLSKTVSEANAAKTIPGGEFEAITHPAEQTVANLKCAELPGMHRQLFELLPPT